jgi:hypothetical protein
MADTAFSNEVAPVANNLTMIRCCIAKIVPKHVSILQSPLLNTQIFVIKIESQTPFANIRYQNSIYYYDYNTVIRYLNPFYLASAQEKHVSIRSGKQTTFALSILKGNAVKNQHRNVARAHLHEHPIHSKILKSEKKLGKVKKKIRSRPK